MHADVVGNLLQRHRAQAGFALFKIVRLPFEDRLNRAQDGVAAHLDAAQEPARFHQLIVQRRGVCAVALAQHALVCGVQSQMWMGGAVEPHHHATVGDRNNRIRHGDFAGLRIQPRLGIEATNRVDGVTQRAHVDCKPLAELIEFRMGQGFQMTGHQACGQRCRRLGALRQLRQQALPQIQGTHSGRVLSHEHGAHLLHACQVNIQPRLRQATRNVDGPVFEVAGLVQRIEQCQGNRQVHGIGERDL